MQVEGAFVQGLGLQTLEEVAFDGQGRLVTTNTWDYKIPTPADIPRQLNVTFLKARTDAEAMLRCQGSGLSGFCRTLTEQQDVQGRSARAADHVVAGVWRCCSSKPKG